MNTRTTVLVESSTRERLKKIGKKGQSYDDLINELIDSKNKDSLDGRFASLQSSESHST
jgi:predicted CopG family antitoxin